MLPFAIVLLLILAINSFLDAYNNDGTNVPKSKIRSLFNSPFLLGVLLSVFNPLQFPYWIGWNKVLIKKSILINTVTKRQPYLIGIGLGTLSALILFIGFGQYILDNFEEFDNSITAILGIVYICFMLYLTYIYITKYNFKKNKF